MSYQCPIEIAFTPRGGSPVTLLAADGWLGDLPELAGEQSLFEADGVLTQEGFFRPLGGATVSFKLVIESDKSTLLAAQNAFIGNTLQASGTLSFIATDWRCDFQASILDTTPELPGDTGAPTLTKTLTIACGLPNYQILP